MAKNKHADSIHFRNQGHDICQHNCGFFGCPCRFGDSSSIGTVNHYAIFCSTPKSELSKMHPDTTRPTYSYEFITKEKWYECEHQIETVRDKITIVCQMHADHQVSGNRPYVVIGNN